MGRPLDPQHLTVDELAHYGELGMVKGLDPNIAGDLEFMIERRLEDRTEDCDECEKKDDELASQNGHRVRD